MNGCQSKKFATAIAALLAVMAVVAIVPSSSAAYRHWYGTAGGNFDDPTLWTEGFLPTNTSDIGEVWYTQSNPITLINDLTTKTLYFYNFKGEFALGDKTLTANEGGIGGSSYSATVRITDGTFIWNKFVHKKGKLVVDGPTAVHGGYGELGVRSGSNADGFNVRMEIVNGATYRGGVQIGRSGSGSNNVFRVSGAGSRFEVPSGHPRELVIGSCGGRSNCLEVVDGAVFENLSTQPLYMDYDTGWGGTLNGQNLLHVSNAAFTNINSTLHVGYNGGHDTAVFEKGSKARIKTVILGYGRKSSDTRILGDNLLDVSGEGTVLNVESGTITIGNDYSRGNVFSLSDDAKARAVYVYAGANSNATTNDIRISSGAELRTHGMEVGYKSVGNRLVLENGSFIGTRSESRPAGESDYMNFGRNVSGDAELVVKGTNSYLYSSYVVMDSLSRIRIEIPEDGLVGTRPLIEAINAYIGSATVQVNVSEGFHDGGRFTLMKWNAGADATAMLNNGRITLTGHRASLIVSEHQIDVKIPSDRGFVITFR